MQLKKLVFSITFYIFIVSFSLSGCSDKSQTEKKLQEDRTAVSKFDGNLKFKDVTLEGAAPQGAPLWKVKAKEAIYSEDKKVAKMKSPSGDLFQDGKVVLQISADTGEVYNAGQEIFLKGNIIATDPRNGAVLKGNELEWIPKKDLLIVRNNLVGTQKQMQVTAKEGNYFTRKQQMELFGQVVGTSKNPDVQMKTEHLIWQLPNEMIIADKKTEIYQFKANKLTGKSVGDWSQVNLKTKIAILRKNVEVTSVDPPIVMTGNDVTWNLNTQVLVSEQPVKMLHAAEQVALSSNRGQVDLEKKVAYLTGGVYGVGSRNKSQLNSNQLTWYIPSQQFEAQGNVIYRQANPPLNLTGPKAFGKLQGKDIVISGGNTDRVVTEIIP